MIFDVDIRLLCSEDPVSGISETGKDISIVVEFAVNTADIYLDIGMSLGELLNALRCSDNAHELDVLTAVTLDGINGINSASACSEHRIHDYDQSLVDRIRKLTIIIMRLMSNRVSVQTDMTYLSKRCESLNAGNHSQACS